MADYKKTARDVIEAEDYFMNVIQPKFQLLNILLTMRESFTNVTPAQADAIDNLIVSTRKELMPHMKLFVKKQTSDSVIRDNQLHKMVVVKQGK